MRPVVLANDDREVFGVDPDDIVADGFVDVERIAEDEVIRIVLANHFDLRSPGLVKDLKQEGVIVTLLVDVWQDLHEEQCYTEDYTRCDASGGAGTDLRRAQRIAQRLDLGRQAGERDDHRRRRHRRQNRYYPRSRTLRRGTPDHRIAALQKREDHKRVAAPWRGHHVAPSDPHGRIEQLNHVWNKGVRTVCLRLDRYHGNEGKSAIATPWGRLNLTVFSEFKKNRNVKAAEIISKWEQGQFPGAWKVLELSTAITRRDCPGQFAGICQRRSGCLRLAGVIWPGTRVIVRFLRYVQFSAHRLLTKR